MEKKRYGCDGGSIAVRCGENIINFINNIGDGDFDCYVFKSEKEFKSRIKARSRFVGCARFKNADVMGYDCCNIDSNDVLFTLTGRYGVYCKKDSGNMYFVKWDD